MRGSAFILACALAVWPWVGHGQVSGTLSGFGSSGGAVVKMSRSGICHPPGGTYYYKTKHYTPYKSMAACLAAGGRAPRR